MQTCVTSPSLVSLRLFIPESSPEHSPPQKTSSIMDVLQRISCDTTLSDFYWNYFRPICGKTRHLDPLTLAEYDTVIRRWILITGDPPMRFIDNNLCAIFVAKALEMPGRDSETISVNTVHKWCIHLQTVLKMAGPTRGEKDVTADEYGFFGLDRFGLPRTTPRLPRPTKIKRPPYRGFTLPEIKSWLSVCDQACKPAKNAAQWWNQLIRFLYNTGLRIGTALQVELSWIKSVEKYSWLEIPSRAYKQDQAKIFPLNEHALKIINEIVPAQNGRLFSFGFSKKTLHVERRRLLTLAGIPTQKHGFHAIRKCTGTNLWRIDRSMAKNMLGHADEETTINSYVHPDDIGYGMAVEMCESLNSLEQP